MKNILEELKEWNVTFDGFTLFDLFVLIITNSMFLLFIASTPPLSKLFLLTIIATVLFNAWWPKFFKKSKTSDNG